MCYSLCATRTCLVHLHLEGLFSDWLQPISLCNHHDCLHHDFAPNELFLSQQRSNHPTCHRFALFLATCTQCTCSEVICTPIISHQNISALIQLHCLVELCRGTPCTDNSNLIPTPCTVIMPKYHLIRQLSSSWHVEMVAFLQLACGSFPPVGMWQLSSSWHVKMVAFLHQFIVCGSSSSTSYTVNSACM